jgi:hypothetical protein
VEVRPLTPRVGWLWREARSSCGELGVPGLGIGTVDTQIIEATTRRHIWVFLVPVSGTEDTQIREWATVG